MGKGRPAVVVCAVVVIGSCLALWAGRDSGGGDERARPMPSATTDDGGPGSREVRLVVGGDGTRASLTWSVDGERGEDPSRPLPSEPVVVAAAPGDLVVFDARNVRGAYGEITCQIVVDGTVVAVGGAGGVGAVASCEATV